MRYEIVFSPEANEDFKNLDARRRAVIRAALETHLRHEPEKISKSRIKRLRGMKRPQYRLRIDEIRVFYDVGANEVQIMGIVSKSRADDWLNEIGELE